MKKIFLLIHLCLVFSALNAQKKQDVYFLKTNGKEVGTKDSADFVRVILEPDSGETNFVMQEYHINGKRKAVGKISAFWPRLVYEGVVMRFDTLGKRKEIATYEKGVPIGMSYQYFSNGKLHKQIEYLPLSTLLAMEIATLNSNSKLIYLADSLGAVQVKDGNGYVKTIEIIGKGEQTEEGGYTDGVKHGIWKGSGTAFGTSFVETYEKGKLISGESTKEGVKYSYTNLGQPPSFKGGVNKFYEYVSYAVRYPSDAVRERVGGTVVLEFTIEKDGRTSEVDVKKSVFPSLDDEAKRVVKFSPKWIPGTMRGVPVRVKYTIPIKFSPSR
ncbi:MAG: energy transducer TonB [Bacteroidota bacterium]